MESPECDGNSLNCRKELSEEEHFVDNKEIRSKSMDSEKDMPYMFEQFLPKFGRRTSRTSQAASRKVSQSSTSTVYLNSPKTHTSKNADAKSVPSTTDENYGKLPPLTQTEQPKRHDRSSLCTQVGALASRKQSQDRRQERLSLSSQVPALSLRQVSSRALGTQHSLPRQYGIPNSLRRISQYLSSTKKDSPQNQQEGNGTQELVSDEIADKMERMDLDEICDDVADMENEALSSSLVSSEVSLPPRTPEPDWAYDLGSEPEKTTTRRGYYRPKRCWCHRCQIMYRMFKNKEPGLENWGNYPCYQW